MTVLELLLGRPLAPNEAGAECVGAAAGIPIFGRDALSSAAYGPEAALTLLIPLGAAGIAHIVPISTSIIVLLAIDYFSDRQTFPALPRWWRVLHRRTPEPRRFRGPSGCGCIDDQEN
jgi:hypothetical protein